MAEVLFVTATEKYTLNNEINGTMLLATKLLQAGIDTDVLRFCQVESFHKDYTTFIGDMTDAIISREPKCVSFYLLWPHAHVMMRLAKEIKLRNPNIITVFGGPQASATAAAIIAAAAYVDYVCTGEGENTVVPFFTTILKEHGANLANIPGLHYRVDGVPTANKGIVPLCDLESLPYWDDRLLTHYNENPEPEWNSALYGMTLDVGRGCPYNCTFCSSSYFWLRQYRLKKPETIVRDMLHYYNKYGIHSFSFSHDALTSNMKLVYQLCDYIQETGLNITWDCSARFDCVNEDLLLRMKQAGMTQIQLGIETGSPRMQKITKKRLNLERVKELIRFMMANKIEIGVFFMCGFPEETEEDLNQTLNLLFSLVDEGVDFVGMAFCQFNPATEITDVYYDQLVYDPNIKILRAAIYGYKEEQQLIMDNKAIFPFYYHLDTPVRRKCQYLPQFVQMYHQFPQSIRMVRKLYQGNDYQFYLDFCENNGDIFSKSISQIDKALHNQPVEMLMNGIQNMTVPYLPQLRSLLQFELDARKVYQSKTDISFPASYDFNYRDVVEKKAIEDFAPGKSDILFLKSKGKVSIIPIHVS